MNTEAEVQQTGPFFYLKGKEKKEEESLVTRNCYSSVHKFLLSMIYPECDFKYMSKEHWIAFVYFHAVENTCILNDNIFILFDSLYEVEKSMGMFSLMNLLEFSRVLSKFTSFLKNIFWNFVENLV